MSVLDRVRAHRCGLLSVSLVGSLAWGAVQGITETATRDPLLTFPSNSAAAELARDLLRRDQAVSMAIAAPAEPWNPLQVDHWSGPNWPAQGTILQRHWLPFKVLSGVDPTWPTRSAAYRNPIEAGHVSSRFGTRRDPFTGRLAMHKGVDFAAHAGTRILAIAAGVVTWSGFKGGYGHIVEIDHGDGLTTRYAHNAENLVGFGDLVSRGQTIAHLGDTGRATGPNLHFEVLERGRPVDPNAYLD